MPFPNVHLVTRKPRNVKAITFDNGSVEVASVATFEYVLNPEENFRANKPTRNMIARVSVSAEFELKDKAPMKQVLTFDLADTEVKAAAHNIRMMADFFDAHADGAAAGSEFEVPLIRTWKIGYQITDQKTTGAYLVVEEPDKRVVLKSASPQAVNELRQALLLLTSH